MKFKYEITSLRRQLFTISTIVIIVLADIFIPLQSYSQINLIPNYSFEDTVVCPTNVSGQYGEQIYSLTNWFPAADSPDYFNSCASNQASNPLSGLGYQIPRSGDGYIGFYTILEFILSQNVREIIGIQLNQNLIVGTKYYFKAYISAAYGGIQNIRYFSNNIGIRFSCDYFEAQQNPLVPNNNPSGNYDSILTDTTNWVPFQFSFVADSAYMYLYIGNFYDNLNTDTILPFGFSSGQGAYYFMDDLCLSTDSNFCETILSSHENKDVPFVIYPNPSTSHLFIKNVRQQQFFIYDLMGRLILSHKIINEDSSIDISNLPIGNYFIRTENYKFKSIVFQKL